MFRIEVPFWEFSSDKVLGTASLSGIQPASRQARCFPQLLRLSRTDSVSTNGQCGLSESEEGTQLPSEVRAHYAAHLRRSQYPSIPIHQTEQISLTSNRRVYPRPTPKARGIDGSYAKMAMARRICSAGKFPGSLGKTHALWWPRVVGNVNNPQAFTLPSDIPSFPSNPSPRSDGFR